MKILCRAFVAFGLAGFFALSAFAEGKIVSGKVWGGFSSPESVFVGRDYIFVANIGKVPDSLAKDNDGFISKLGKNGRVVKKDFARNLNAPKGMIEIDSTLYVVDIDRLVAFDMQGKMVLESHIQDAIFLNDIVLLDSNTLLLSDTGNGIIYAFNLQSKQTSEFAKLDLTKTGGGNGMLLDKAKQVLFVVCYHPDGKSGGQVLAIDTKTKAVKILDSQKGAYDGVALAKNGDLLVSDWGENLNGKIYRISAKNGFSRDSLFGKNANANVFTKTALNLPVIKGPADMFGTKDTLYIPKMLENEVLVVDLP